MRFVLSRGALAVLVGVSLLSCADSPTAPRVSPSGPRANLTIVPPAVVISQVYGGGGNSGAPLKNDFVELFNPGTTTVNITGWKIQYTSSTGTTWTNTTVLPSASIAPGKYYLVQMGGGSVGVALPSPDATGTTAMALGAGKLLLTRPSFVPSGSCPVGSDILDHVGYGSASNCAAEWQAPTGTISNTTAAIRNSGGCAFTDNASVDFAVAAPSPRNSATVASVCPTQPVEPVSVEVSPATASIPVSTTRTFTAVARDGTLPVGNVVSTTFEWSSDNTSVATVDKNTGVATGVTAGTAKITAKASNGVTGFATLTVTPPQIVDVVISQVYGGGGNSSATYTHDYVELFNRGPDPVDIAGWTVQYSSATSTTWSSSGVTTLPAGTIASGKYYLIRLASNDVTVGSPLPAADATGSANMAGGAGKVIVTLPGMAPTAQCPSGTGIVDRIGYGTGSNCGAEWGGTTSTLTNSTAAFRKNDGCVKTGSTSADFIALASFPRNSASSAKNCGGGPPRPVSAATLVINELMGDPANAENASWGEWFEVYNYGTQPIDLNGWTIITGGTSQPDHRVNTSVIVPAGGRAVLGRGADATRNGGVTLDYNYFVGTAATIWLDDSDYLGLVDGAGALADSVAWTSLAHGVTRALRDASVENANVDGANWGYSTVLFGDGDYGTPHDANGVLANIAPVVSANRLVLSGRSTADDPTLAVGFEAQEFVDEETDTGVPVTTTTFTWTSLTSGIASIDQRGVIHAIAAGLARFKVESSDGATRVFSIPTVTATASTTALYGNNAAFGKLTPGTTKSTDFIIERTEYTTSYNGSRGILNWAAYDLNGTHIKVGEDRCNCFTFDPELVEAGFTPYNTADYTGAGAFAQGALLTKIGIDRGHMVRSFDRTTGSLDNARTYFMSNVVPQYADLNQGPWANMENYLGDFARFQNKEVYIYVGPSGTSTEYPLTGSDGTVKNQGKITIPKYTWKVAAIMPRGKGPADVHDYRDLQVIAAVMPNVPFIHDVDWQTNYVVTVDSVEKLTGYHFFASLSARDQRALKTNTKPPIGALDGAYTSMVGNSVAMSGAGSLDPNGTIVSYAWDFGDGAVATGATTTHTYANTGSFTVRLIVTDNSALVDTVTTIATVGPRAPNCGFGKFEDASAGYACVEAPAGSYVGVTNASSATQCLPGSFQPATGQSSCMLAQPGSFVADAGATQSTPCSIGTYQDASGATSCKPAPAGKFVATEGAASATDCVAGTFQAAVGQTGCEPAPPGSYVALAGATAANLCAIGTFQGASGATECTNALAGTYVDIHGAVAPKDCQPGSYQALTGAAECTPAPAGRFVGAARAVAATPCDVGSYQPNAGATSCLISSPGSYVAAVGASSATPCDAGTYQNATGAASCLLSPAGSHVPTTGAALATPCAVGTYQNAAGATECKNAPAGTYVDSQGAIAPQDCQPGSYQNMTGAVACIPAPAGRFVATVRAVASTPCDVGSYQPNSGATACLLSPPGAYVPTLGALSSTPCALGSYQSASGATSCISAPIGSYVAMTGAVSATACPVGMTTNAVGTTSESGCVWLPPAVLTQTVADLLQQMINAGYISEQNANPISQSIEQAQRSIEQGNFTPAANQLGAARNKIEAAVKTGKITGSATALLAAIDRAIAHM